MQIAFASLGLDRSDGFKKMQVGFTHRSASRRWGTSSTRGAGDQHTVGAGQTPRHQRSRRTTTESIGITRMSCASKKNLNCGL
jgi:hypothetical protein